MYHSLKIKPKLSIDSTKNRNAPQSQPSSPRKFKIQKRVGNIICNNDNLKMWN